MFALTPTTCMTNITPKVDSKGFLGTMGFQQLYKLLQVIATDRARYCITYNIQHSVYTKLLYLHIAAVLAHLSTLPIVGTFFLTVLSAPLSLIFLYTCILFEQSSVLRFDTINCKY